MPPVINIVFGEHFVTFVTDILLSNLPELLRQLSRNSSPLKVNAVVNSNSSASVKLYETAKQCEKRFPATFVFSCCVIHWLKKGQILLCVTACGVDSYVSLDHFRTVCYNQKQRHSICTFYCVSMSISECWLQNVCFHWTCFKSSQLI